MSDKKKGRTMTPELLEKLSKAREKGLEVIRAKREAKQKAKEELMKKTYEIMATETKHQVTKMPKKKQIEEVSEEEESDYSIKARYEEPTKRKKKSTAIENPLKVCEAPPAKYNNVKKVVKKKIVYMNESESEDSEEEIVYIPRSKKINKQKIKQTEEIDEKPPTEGTFSTFTSQYLSLF